jgi:predicted ATPase
VRLFVERAEAAGSDLPDDEPTTGAIGETVERLDGTLLTVELAAGRARSRELAELASNLDDRFRLLSGGWRRSGQRQASLEGAVQWSYDLLDDEERSVLQVRPVFQGRFDLPDVTALAGLPLHRISDIVDCLVAKSLIDLTWDRTGELRHRLLETIRRLALVRRIDSGEAAIVRGRHLEHFEADPVGELIEKWGTEDGGYRVTRAYENIRSAVTRALETDRHSSAVHQAAIASDAVADCDEIRLTLDCLQLPDDQLPERRVMSWALLG